VKLGLQHQACLAAEPSLPHPPTQPTLPLSVSRQGGRKREGGREGGREGLEGGRAGRLGTSSSSTAVSVSLTYRALFNPSIGGLLAAFVISALISSRMLGLSCLYLQRPRQALASMLHVGKCAGAVKHLSFGAEG
jgi:hypothetical protein